MHAVLFKKCSRIYNSACERRTSTDCTTKIPREMYFKCENRCIISARFVRLLLKYTHMLCAERLNGNAHTHEAGLLFTLSKVSLSFHSRSSRWVGFWSAPGLTAVVRMRRRPFSTCSALLISHVATLGWQSVDLSYQLRLLHHGEEENKKRAELRRKTASCLSLRLHLLLFEDIKTMHLRTLLSWKFKKNYAWTCFVFFSAAEWSSEFKASSETFTSRTFKSRKSLTKWQFCPWIFTWAGEANACHHVQDHGSR